MRSKRGDAILRRYQIRQVPETAESSITDEFDSVTVDDCQYISQHTRVMFRNVKAAICVGDLGFDRASSLDFSPSGFSSISQILTLLASR